MATATTQEHAGAGAHEVHHPTDLFYWKVGGALGVLTALEVSTYFITDDPYSQPWMIAALLIGMVVKFVIILGAFMHLRFDSKVFRYVFTAGLTLAIVVYAVLFTTFSYWSSSYEEGLGQFLA
jgi:cytochrome c oxidase subunit 4